MTELHKLASDTRRRGNSRLLLQMAIINPQVIIVYSDFMKAERQEMLYKQLYKELAIPNTHNIEPKFVSVNYDFTNCNWPVLFDSSIFTLLKTIENE